MTKLERALLELKTQRPGSAEAEHLYGLVQLRLKRTQLAEPSLRRCVALDGGNQQMRMDLADMLMQQGRDEDAVQVLQVLADSQSGLTPEYLAILGDCQLRFRLGRTRWLQ